MECSNGTRYYKCATYKSNEYCNSSSIDADKLEKNIEIILKDKMNITGDELCHFIPDNTWLTGINHLYKERYNLDEKRPDFENLFEIYSNNIKIYLNNLIEVEENLLRNKSLWYKDGKKYTCADMLIFIKKITVDLENKDLDVDFGQLGHSHMLLK